MTDLTKRKFDKQQKYICKKLYIKDEVYHAYTCLIVKYMGDFDPDKTYCGRGESGDKYTPDLWYRWSGYVHDGLVSAYEHGHEELDKGRIDDYFRYSMYFINGWKFWRSPIAELFYIAVDNLGDYEFNKYGDEK